MENSEALAINKLLRYDLCQFAKKIGLSIDEELYFSNEDAVEVLNIAEDFSRYATSESDRLKCLTICALIWEHRREEWAALPPFLSQLLSRLGLGPTIRMIDNGFNEQDNAFSSLGSVRAEMHFTAWQLEHEIKVVNNKTLLLSSFQKRAWDCLNKYSRVGISAPTSAGKSFVILTWIIQLLSQNDGVIFYIVPTISLIQQVSLDLKIGLKKYGVADVRVAQTYSPKYSHLSRKNIYVLTQERALSALGFYEGDRFNSPLLLVVDEVQNIERVANESDERAHMLFDVLASFVNDIKPRQVIVSGPKLSNMTSLSKKLLGEDAFSVTADLPPVVNMTYAFSKGPRSKVYLKQYCEFSKYPQQVIVKNVDPKAIGGVRYTERIHGLIAQITKGLSNDSASIVFSPTSGQAARTAVALSATFQKVSQQPLLEELSDYIADSVHPSYPLKECVMNGIAYHHGKMPQHLRVSVEQGFSEKMFNVLVCTTTLMQGINMPAKNLIARNPNLYVSSQASSNSQLTRYEFSNLRGRAGRLMKDFVGRAIILDEGAFGQHQDDLFGFPAKEVESSFGNRFIANKKEIVNALEQGIPVSQLVKGGGIITLVRQAIMKFGEQAKLRLAAIGIILSESEFADARQSLSMLAVPVRICQLCQYWDPIDLEKIYKLFSEGYFASVPTHPNDLDYNYNFLNILIVLQREIPFYFKKILPEVTELGTMQSVVRMARDWSSEQTLRSIISWEPDDVKVSGDEIDRRISRINQTVMYQLPKLLKPIVAMGGDTNPVLSYMEMGAVYPETRRLIELGIPRETAVKLRNYVSFNLDFKAGADDEALSSAVLYHYNNLNYWEKEQVKNVFG